MRRDRQPHGRPSCEFVPQRPGLQPVRHAIRVPSTCTLSRDVTPSAHMPNRKRNAAVMHASPVRAISSCAEPESLPKPPSHIAAASTRWPRAHQCPDDGAAPLLPSSPRIAAQCSGGLPVDSSDGPELLSCDVVKEHLFLRIEMCDAARRERAAPDKWRCGRKTSSKQATLQQWPSSSSSLSTAQQAQSLTAT